jgi:hypothetical protein
MAPFRLMIPFWKKRIARAFVGPSGKSQGGQRALTAAGLLLLERAYLASRSKVARVGKKMPSGNKVWLPSFVSLGAADVASVSAGPTPALMGLKVLGVAGGAGLLVTSLADLKKAKTVEQLLDAAGDLAWGAQGLLTLASSPRAAVAAVGLGIVGAAAQTAAGVQRIRTGIVRGDRSVATLGVLDLGGGLLWLGWEILGWDQPLFVGSYVVLMVGREAYANRKVVIEFLRSLQADASSELAVGRDIVLGVKDLVAQALARPTEN